MKKRPVLITNVQRFCLHDGPGIRTTVFLKGCNLRCPWCANPESISMSLEVYGASDEHALYGKEYNEEELVALILRDEVFFGEGGGVTFSGGEPLLQMKNMETVFGKLKEKGIHICIETALFASEESLEIAIKYVDLFYVDLKILNAEKCQKIIGGNLGVYMENLETLFAKTNHVIFRMPMIIPYTISQNEGEEDMCDNLKCALTILEKYRPMALELVQGHNLAEKKYELLNQKAYRAEDVPAEWFASFRNKVRAMGIVCEVCRI